MASRADYAVALRSPEPLRLDDPAALRFHLIMESLPRYVGIGPHRGEVK